MEPETASAQGVHMNAVEHLGWLRPQPASYTALRRGDWRGKRLYQALLLHLLPACVELQRSPSRAAGGTPVRQLLTPRAGGQDSLSGEVAVAKRNIYILKETGRMLQGE